MNLVGAGGGIADGGYHHRVPMATLITNGGGAWDNAKKCDETGAGLGKNLRDTQGSRVGDTVGDPSKDTAGPSLHVLIKLLSTIGAESGSAVCL